MINNDFKVNLDHDHKSGRGIYAKSRPVQFDLREGGFMGLMDKIKLAKRMAKWLNDNNGHFPNTYNKAYAVSHCQVSDNPYAFFVVSKDLINEMKLFDTLAMSRKNFYFASQVILNARILVATDKIEGKVPKREVTKDSEGKVGYKITHEDGLITNKIMVPDCCMSFPDKKPKNTEIYYRIKVRYQIPAWYGLKTKTEWVEGLKSHIFQHEINHANGKNIYYAK